MASDERPYASTSCPYCQTPLAPLPRAKKKCPACHQSIYVRSGPDGLRYLLRDTDLPVLEQAWAEYHAEKHWRGLALDLTDEASLTALLADLQASDPRYTFRDAYWHLANRNVIELARVGDWHRLKLAYFTMALAAYEEAEDRADSTGTPTDSARARLLIRESNLAGLRVYAAMDVTHVTIISDCDRCRPGSDHHRPIAAEILAPVLPREVCDDGLCRCDYSPAF